ncbi:hypothetical protein [Deferrisoma palaeochoriense]
MLYVSATSVKNWFQYRCQRKFVYETMGRSQRKAIPILEEAVPEVWAEFGRDYERRVVEQYARTEGVRLLRPTPGQDSLSERQSLAFLAGKLDSTAAHQLLLTETSTLRKTLSLEDIKVNFTRGLVDLALVREEGGERVIRLVDIKSTQVATSFHKMQVAWYAWMLGSTLRHHGIDAEVDETGEIWHCTAPGGGAYAWERSEFPLASYMSLLADWARRDLPNAAACRVDRDFDNTFFHIYFKCEQCRFLPHCRRAIEGPPTHMDVSAVPGVSHQTKRTLHGLGIRTVGEMVSKASTYTGGHAADTDWRLANWGRTLWERAGALLDRRWRFVPGAVTLRMPPKTDVSVCLAADRDPVAGRLATVGALVTDSGTETLRVVRLIRTPQEESSALLEVLGQVVGELARVDRENQERPPGEGKILHVFVYEPAEARDLAEALGRHLDNELLTRCLLDLIRMFPPESVVPEPEYRGYHHLPACALRSVVEELLALPVRVSFDLAQVCEALSAADPPLSHPYRPGDRFRRPFSSRLPLEICRDLELGTADEAAVRSDVEARLEAVRALVAWLEGENERVAPEDFLRLRKAPFRLHATLHPLRARHLELLRAVSLLEERAGRLAALHELAQPIERRRMRQRCIPDLRLVRQWRKGKTIYLQFEAPSDADWSDIRPGDMGLILSDGHPDRVLDPANWENLWVRLEPPHEDLPTGHLVLSMYADCFYSEEFRALWAKQQGSGWVLDRAFFDLNTDRLDRFLQYVDGVQP